jgi:4-amino-4-deoxychorismate lyase
LTFVSLNGQIVPMEEAKLPVTDRALLYGDGLFTTLRVRNGRAECLSLHLERLEAHCRALNIRPPHFSPIDPLIRANGATTGTWRLKILVTGGQSPALHLPQRQSGALLMLLTPFQELLGPSTLCLYPEPIQRPLAKLKTLAYLDRLFIKEYATQKNCDDAIVTTSRGYWLETAFSNLFWRLDDRLLTPHQEQPLLTGIALTLVRQAASSLGMRVEPVLAKKVPREAQLYQCNSLSAIRPVISVEGQSYPRDPLFETQLKEQFERLVTF